MGFGRAPVRLPAAYWSGWDIARGLSFDAARRGGYVLDGFGGTHRFGGAPNATPTAYWPGWDIAKGVATWASPIRLVEDQLLPESGEGLTDGGVRRAVPTARVEGAALR